MLTPRGASFLIGLLALLAALVALEITALTLVGLTLLLWFLAQWLAFVVRVRVAAGRLRVRRGLFDAKGPVRSLWARSPVRVRVELGSDSDMSLPYVRITDRLPVLLEESAERGKGRRGRVQNEADGPVARGQPLRIEYRVECAAAGVVRFDGLLVQIADVHGFFYHAAFVADVRTYRSLPGLADVRGRIPAAKRHNLLPLLGYHRHARPGTGSELLDLRDYLPGDPPKTIAWKVSARRDKLMTKEFESEVPIRCTLFVDTSDAVRVGVPGRNPLARLVEIAAGVAQATAGSRDLTGLCLVSEKATRVIRPARGSRHVVKVLNRLAEAAAVPAGPVAAPLARILPLAFALAQERYPELLRPEVNHVPWWLPWLTPQPAYTVPRPPLLARSLWIRPWVWLRRRWRYLRLALRQTLIARGSPHYRRHYRWRKQLAALLSVRYGLAPDGLAMLLEDDRLCVQYLQRFLAEHQVPAPMPLFDAQGRYLFASPEKLDRLSRTLLAAVAKGRDNELFVLLADLLEGTEQLGKLLSAVKVALARHHQVMVICPWPPDVPLPARTDPQRSGADTQGENPPVAEFARIRGPHPRASVLDSLLWRLTTTQLHQAFFQLRRSFARLGVPVVCAGDADSTALILKRLQHLRTLQRGVR